MDSHSLVCIIEYGEKLIKNENSKFLYCIVTQTLLLQNNHVLDKILVYNALLKSQK